MITPCNHVCHKFCLYHYNHLQFWLLKRCQFNYIFNILVVEVSQLCGLSCINMTCCVLLSIHMSAGRNIGHSIKVWKIMKCIYLHVCCCVEGGLLNVTTIKFTTQHRNLKMLRVKSPSTSNWSKYSVFYLKMDHGTVTGFSIQYHSKMFKFNSNVVTVD